MATTTQLEAFFARQRHLLAKERDADIERSSLLLSNCGPKLLEQKGLALGGLGVVGVNIGLGGKTLVELERPTAYHTTPIFPPHNLRPGDLARIEENVLSSTKKSSSKGKKPAAGGGGEGSAGKGTGVEGVVYKVSDTRIVIAIDSSDSDSDNDFDLPERCRVVKLANSVTYDRMDKAIDQVERTVLGTLPSNSSSKPPPAQELTPLIRVLLGIADPSPPKCIEDLTFFDPHLNPSQKDAVRFCLEAQEVACIHGPPGTGKTHTLIEIIRQLTAPTLTSGPVPSSSTPIPTSTADPGAAPISAPLEGLKLLVCGASNLAVDNILERLLVLPVGSDGKPDSSVSDSKKQSKPRPTDASQRQTQKFKVTRLGHPARVMADHPGILDVTLEVKAGPGRSEQAALAKDVKNELEATLGILSGRGSRSSGTAGKEKGKGPVSAGGAKPKPGAKPRGAERKKMWQDVKELRKEYRRREGGVVKTVIGESQVVLATCHSAGGRQLWNTQFDVVIIDEATQALEAVCWIPILQAGAKKLILAGDPMQLPPTVLSLGGDRRKKHEKEKQDKGKRENVKPGHDIGQRKEAEVNPNTTGDVEEGNAADDDSDSDDEDEDDGQSETGTETEMEKEENDHEAMASTTTVSTDLEAKTKTKPTRPEHIARKRRSLRPPRTLETTLFDRLEYMYGSSIKRMLKVQYRMHAQICAFPSKTLYSSRLKSDPSVASHLLRDLPGTHAESEEDEKEVLGTPVVFFDTAGCEYFERLEGDGDEGSRCNENEAEVVRSWIQRLVDTGVLPSQIAVITPYQAQVTILTSLLRPTYGPSLEIGTVDGMQGREKDAVIISLVRSNENREVGFLKEKRRLNVAMTRAKRHLCIVGDSSTVCHGGSYLKKWLSWLDTHADIRYAGPE